jgi:hypothetical protein
MRCFARAGQRTGWEQEKLARSLNDRRWTQAVERLSFHDSRFPVMNLRGRPKLKDSPTNTLVAWARPPLMDCVCRGIN